MDNYIKVYDDVIDETSCKELIKRFEDEHEMYETVHQEESDSAISFEQLNLFTQGWNDVQKGLLNLF